MSARRVILRGLRPVLGLGGLLLLAACAGQPPVPDWRMNAHAASERALAAYLGGETKVEVQEARRLRREIARAGDAGLLARAELLRCAAHVASLVMETCPAFEALRPDAEAADLAYADYLMGRVDPKTLPWLPAPHQKPAQRLLRAGPPQPGDAAILQAMADPLGRLVAAGVWMRAGLGHPAVTALAVQTASAQGWSRPLVAWLQAQAREADLAGDTAGADKARRRIELVLSGGRAP